MCVFAKDKFKTIEFRLLPFQNTKLINHWPFITGYICPAIPRFDLPTPNLAGSSNLSSFRSRDSGIPGIRDRNAIFFRSGVPAQICSFIFEFPAPENPLHTFLGTRGYFRANLSNRFPAGT